MAQGKKPDSIDEDVGLILGPTQWVREPGLPRTSVGLRQGSDPVWLWLWLASVVPI